MCYLRRPVEAENQETLFSDQPSSYKFLTHIFTLELHTSPYPALHDLVSSAETQNNILLQKIKEDGEKEKIL